MQKQEIKLTRSKLEKSNIILLLLTNVLFDILCKVDYMEISSY